MAEEITKSSLDGCSKLNLYFIFSICIQTWLNTMHKKLDYIYILLYFW